jgi:hypothetical protein
MTASPCSSTRRARKNKRLGRAVRRPSASSPASIEAIDYPARRELDKAVIRRTHHLPLG